MEYVVRIHKKDSIVEKKAEEGTNLLKFLRKNSIDVHSPCGGNGTCGKCKIKVEGLTSDVSHKEKSVLGSKGIEKGLRLACYNKIYSDIDIYLEDKEEHNIVTEIKEKPIVLEPFITKQCVDLTPPDINNQASDFERVIEVVEKLKSGFSIEFLRPLPDTLRHDDFKVTLVYMDEKLIAVESGDTTDKLLGIAVDIGTTTIAAYLVDMVSGKKLDVHSVLNPQRKYGADVLSRINYTASSETALKEMNDTIISCINQIIKHFCTKNDLKKQEIYTIVFAGNTTMMHFLMKLPAKNMAVSPFIPVTTHLHKFKAKELGISINPCGFVVILPSVSAYVGADTVAGVLSCGMYKDENISLLVDIGTNGEIVLGNKRWLLSCSTAAGPALEGANIRNGIGAVKGAIDIVNFKSGFSYTTISNTKAVGICGSGIIDAVAGLLDSGIVDERGRMLKKVEAGETMPDELKDRLIEVDNSTAFALEQNGEGIVITQKDIREIQNGKAAIAAGINILAKKAGIVLEDISKVYLAGGFGNHINIESALRIGLLPDKLEGKIESIGNAAGAGAVEMLVSAKMLKQSVKIKEKMDYIELSACSEFEDEYIDAMGFSVGAS